MIDVAAVVAVCLFAAGLRWCRVVETTGSGMLAARGAMRTLLDASLSDDEKERAARASSRQLLIYGATMLGRLGMAILVPAAFVGALAVMGLLDIPAFAGVLESWHFAVISSVLVGAALLWR